MVKKSRKSNIPTQASQSDVFRGELEAMYTASLLTGLNAQTITVPGWGKTKMSLWMGRQVTGEDGTLLMECNPAMQPDLIRGTTDVKKLIETGNLERIVENTPYDDKVAVVILDEYGRLSDIAFDLLIHATNDYLRDVRPVFWGTSNFAAKGQRTEAFRDRFALNYIPTLKMDDLTVHQVVRNNDISTWTFSLPSLQDIDAVRSMVPTEQSEQALDTAVMALYQAITTTAEGKRFIAGLNPRRIEAWREIMFRVSAYYYQTNDFANIHPEAGKAMRFAYPVQDPVEYAAWVTIAAAVADPCEAAIEDIRNRAFTAMQEIQAQASNPNAKQAAMGQLGVVVANAEQELAQFNGDDRAANVSAELHEMFIQFAQGKG